MSCFSFSKVTLSSRPGVSGLLVANNVEQENEREAGNVPMLMFHVLEIQQKNKTATSRPVLHQV